MLAATKISQRNQGFSWIWHSPRPYSCCLRRGPCLALSGAPGGPDGLGRGGDPRRAGPDRGFRARKREKGVLVSEMITRNVGPASIEMAYERIGDPAAPPVLLIQGIGAQLVGWPD